MKPKPNHYLRMRIWRGDKVIATYEATNASKLMKKAKCPIGRIHTNYRQGRISLKIDNLAFEIDQVKHPEPIVVPAKLKTCQICV